MSERLSVWEAFFHRDNEKMFDSYLVEYIIRHARTDAPKTDIRSCHAAPLEFVMASISWGSQEKDQQPASKLDCIERGGSRSEVGGKVHGIDLQAHGRRK